MLEEKYADKIAQMMSRMIRTVPEGRRGVGIDRRWRPRATRRKIP